MTDKDLNRAIATKLGWKPIPPIPGREHLFDGYMLKPDAKSESDIDKVPDFCGSLDAMHVAEEWLSVDQRRDGMGRRDPWPLDWDKLTYDELWDCYYHVSAKKRAFHFAHITGILPVAGKEVEG